MRERPNMRGSRNTPTTALQPAILVKIHVHTHAHTHTVLTFEAFKAPDCICCPRNRKKKRRKKQKES